MDMSDEQRRLPKQPQEKRNSTRILCIACWCWGGHSKLCGCSLVNGASFFALTSFYVLPQGRGKLFGDGFWATLNMASLDGHGPKIAPFDTKIKPT